MEASLTVNASNLILRQIFLLYGNTKVFQQSHIKVKMLYQHLDFVTQAHVIFDHLYYHCSKGSLLAGMLECKSSTTLSV